jgi:opacity protein-like surface antigen
MKKIILSAVAVLAFGFANAQESNGGFAKGDVLATGSFGVGSEKTGDSKTNIFEIAPSVGYFVSENIAIGARVGFASIKETGEEKINDFKAEVFGRYYITPASKFSVFGELATGIGSSKQGDFKSKSFGINAGLGVNYFLSSNWAIEAAWAGLGYESNDNGGNGADKTNSFGLAIDLSAINFGLTYKF